VICGCSRDFLDFRRGRERVSGTDNLEPMVELDIQLESITLCLVLCPDRMVELSIADVIAEFGESE
jgi:hypothetical protein